MPSGVQNPLPGWDGTQLAPSRIPTASSTPFTPKEYAPPLTPHVHVHEHACTRTFACASGLVCNFVRL